MLIALRNLFKDKMRLVMSIAGVALAVMLVLVLNGFLAGLTMQIGAYLTHEPGTLVVAQDGVENLLGVASQLPAGTLESVRARGAKQVVPILSQSVIFEMHGRKQFAYLIGYEPQTGGGPWQLASGRDLRNDKEIIFDRILAQRHEVGLGDRVELLDEKFTVVGFSEGTNSWMTGFIFVRKTALESLLRVPSATSFLLVTPAEYIGTERLRVRLSDLLGTNVLTKEKMIANDVKLFGAAFLAPIQLMAAIAFLVGGLVVGLVIYTATVERQREYGVLKAIGAHNGLLYRVVTLQALIAAIGGSALGVVLAYGAAELIMVLRPQFLIVYQPIMLFQSLGAGVAMALIAALAPARVVAQLAPAEVFRK